MRLRRPRGWFLANFLAALPLAAVLLGAVLLGALALAACGGQVGGERGQEDGEEEGGVNHEAPPEGSEGDEPAPGELALEECELGFELGEEGQADEPRPCNWIAEGRCYETKARACSCVCPRDAPSICLSDFYGGEGSQTEVICN